MRGRGSAVPDLVRELVVGAGVEAEDAAALPADGVLTENVVRVRPVQLDDLDRRLAADADVLVDAELVPVDVPYLWNGRGAPLTPRVMA